jgi:hypothetical protein
VEAQRKPAVAVVWCLLLGEAGGLAQYQHSQRGCLKYPNNLISWANVQAKALWHIRLRW